MLNAIVHATLNDDVFREDQTTLDFEAEMARLCGHEDAAFVITGTMANQLALRTLVDQPPHAILADAHAHIIHWEAGGVAHLSGAMVQPIRPRNRRYLTLEDIAKRAVVTDDVHKCPTRVISIENTASGTIVPLRELQRMRAWAKANGIKIHIDGARLWEAVAAGAGTIREFAQCCDALTLDFSKNLGAPMGAMVVGSAELIGRLRRIRKSLGGGMRAAGVLTAAARHAIVENFGMGQTDSRRKLKRSHELARRAATIWTGKGGQLGREVETNMVWLDPRAAGLSNARFNELGLKHGIKLDGKRLVLHHQICERAMQRLDSLVAEVFERPVPHSEAGSGDLIRWPVRARL